MKSTNKRSTFGLIRALIGLACALVLLAIALDSAAQPRAQVTAFGTLGAFLGVMLVFRPRKVTGARALRFRTFHTIKSTAPLQREAKCHVA
jgi:hypothetical protein